MADTFQTARRLLLRAVLLTAPFVLVGAFVFVVDPYDYFGTSRVVPDRVKEVTAGKLHYPMWKVHQFRRAPAPNILLGDSRMDLLDTGAIHAATGERYFNLAYGGGTPTEAIDTYWLLAKSVKLKSVYLEMGIINFNGFQNLNRVVDVRSMDAHPLKYLSNRVVLRAAAMAAYVAMTGDTLNVEAPSLGPSQFWRFQIDEAMPQLLHLYAYPVDLARRLQEMAADCRKKGTRLVILIPPTHVDGQAKVAELGREADAERFKGFAATLGTVYDFDYPNALTRDRGRFVDPFHLKDSSPIIHDVWGTSPVYARVGGVCPDTQPSAPICRHT